MPNIIKIELTKEEMSFLNLLMGMALGATPVREYGQQFRNQTLKLLNKVNTNNENFTPYHIVEIPEVK